MDPIALTRELVQIDSPTGQEGPVGQYFAQRLEGLGYTVTRQEVTPGRWNLYATREPPVVVFSTHLDVVPPSLPFAETATHIHGRGSCDAKGIAAAQVAAAERLAAEGERRIGLLFVVGEEYGSDGARAVNALSPKGRFIVNGEPTENCMALGHKGALYARLTTHGRACHSAYPEDGSSAIEFMLDGLARIRQLELPIDEILGPSTLNIGTINGGVRPNVIPEACQAELLIRTVMDSSKTKAALIAAAGKNVKVDFAWEMSHIRLKGLPDFPTTVVKFSTDLPFYAQWGEGFLLGPGTIKVAHTTEERIAKQEILDGAGLYERLAVSLLARPVSAR